MKTFWWLSLWVAVMLTVIWGTFLAGAGEHHGHGPADEHPVASGGVPLEIFDPGLRLSDRVRALTEQGVFSCATLCHDKLIANSVRREGPIVGHPDVALHHGEHTWCLDCHSEKNRDALRLIDDTEVGFNESFRLCGQCHGPIYKDWKYGAHGQRTGHWNAEPNVWPCVRCHDPHDPAFKALDALPAPKTRFDK